MASTFAETGSRAVTLLYFPLRFPFRSVATALNENKVYFNKKSPRELTNTPSLELFNSPNNRRYISVIRCIGTTNVVKIFVSANLFLHISKRFYIFADVGKG